MVFFQTANVYAQSEVDTATTSQSRIRGGAEAATETIVIKGTKKARGQAVLDAPVAVTVFSEEQLEAYRFQDIESLTFSMPNVSLDTAGTVKGVANFSIRGLGANSSIPTIDPTVGLFVNGVYYGSNTGAVLDSFDLESIEVLRGPQGVLFGRNVTGGAVLMQTKRPGDSYSATLRAGVETGLEYRIRGAVDAPIAPGLLKLRLAGLYRSDEGWFTNQRPVPGGDNPLAPDTVEEQFGEEEAWLIRPTATFTPTDDIRVDVVYERGQIRAAGPLAQNSSRANPNHVGQFDGFDASIDEPGRADYDWDQISVEATLDLGSYGQIVNIFGWRSIYGETLSDIDSRPVFLFHSEAALDLEQFSNELRYSGELFSGFVDLTAGVYLFSMDLIYRESRQLLFGNVNSTYGGDQDQLSLGVFSQAELNLTNTLALILGGRVTHEEKEAQIASFSIEGSPCEPIPSTVCENFPFSDKEDWLNFSPKIGLQWQASPSHLLYAHWTRGFRSGGYNVRNTSPDPAAIPGPFDEEQQDAFEFGFKGQLWGKRFRYGFAGFFTRMLDMQRELNIPGEVSGVVQIIRNTADANVYGFEWEATLIPVNGLVISSSLGYTDSDYTDVRFDLNEDGLIDDRDRDLSLPRLENISANIQVLYDLALGNVGLLTFRTSYSYRDDSFFTDNNLGQLPDGHVINAGVTYALPELDVGQNSYIAPRINVYGRNLLNEAFLGGQTPLPANLGEVPLGGNFSPLKEGRVIGVELGFDWI